MSDSADDQGESCGERKLVSRLIGMETEYATLILDRPELSRDNLPASRQIFEAICDEIRKDQPTAVGVMDSEQMFLASGGAVTFESHPALQTLPGGLIEIATPEVNSPTELLACQRSIDELVAEAANEIDMDVDLRVMKNSSDAMGHVYGCQENYEAVVATGLWLILYRMMIGLLWVMQFFGLLMSMPVLAFVFLFLYRRSSSNSESGDEVQRPGELFESMPRLIKWSVIAALRVIHFPIVVVLRFVASHIAFRRQRRFLTAFLISRVSLCGTGDLDHDGCYRLSAKAMAIDTLCHMGSYRGERPIFVMGHWLALLCSKSFVSLAATRQLFRKRQRLQIGLSDSNLCDLAEYVKVGSVSLLLDMIESKATKGLPIIKRPIESLHQITQDWNLVARVETSRGRLSALEIQTAYLKAARAFVASVPQNRRGEAELVIERWQALLDSVYAFRKDARDMSMALGRVDWLSKRWMLDQLDDGAEWIARKKTDLRYHELSDEGYHRKLSMTNPELRLVDPEHVRRRRRSPPADSPAARRGWTIREFSGADESLQSEWTYALLGQGRDRRKLPFERDGEDGG